MASLATFVNRFVGVRAVEGVPAAVWTRTEAPRLRPLANEDVYLFVKRIDNTGVVRAADPTARRARTRSVATGVLAAMLVIMGLAPAAYNTMAGFELQNLRKQQDELKQQQATLDLEQAQLLSPARLDQLAKSLKLVEPVPTALQYLDGKAARNADARVEMPLGNEVAAR